MSSVAATGWFDALNDKATIAHFTREKFSALRTPLPPIPEQAAIVRYLDYADRRIRRYIRAKQKLVTLLEEQKQALIRRAVTRGLDPNVRLKLPQASSGWGTCRCIGIYARRNGTSGKRMSALRPAQTLGTAVRVSHYGSNAAK